MKGHLAILGASSLQLPLIEKARDMGYITHVFAWAAQDVGEEAADFFYPISITEKETILEQCRRIGICGICSIASDLAMVTVNYVAQNLGLPGNTIEATLKSTNKHEMRKTFRAHGDPSPWSISVDAQTDLEALDLTYPIIVKPTDRSGSRGICKLESPDMDALRTAVIHAMEQGFEKKALIEEFAEGQEYSVEYISYQGNHHFLAMTLKSTTGAPQFVETGHMEPAPVNQETLEQVKAVVEHALDSLGIECGASHSELKIREDGTIRIIEIGGRMGGDCIGSDLVQLSTGMDFLAMVIQVACGQAPDLTPVCPGRPAAVKFIFTQEDLETLADLQHRSPEKLVRIVDLHTENIGNITDSSNRAGSYVYFL